MSSLCEMIALHDLCWNFLFSHQMICKQHIVLNHVFFQYESNLEPVRVKRGGLSKQKTGFSYKQIRKLVLTGTPVYCKILRVSTINLPKSKMLFGSYTSSRGKMCFELIYYKVTAILSDTSKKSSRKIQW